jgi:peroxiredoxin Q/BCP
MTSTVFAPGTAAPEFALANEKGATISLKGLRGKWVVLYMYPKDNTSGCTLEAQEFSQLMPRFAEKNCLVFGISPDSGSSHCRFIEKQGLSVSLLSDPDSTMLTAYGSWQTKSMYGRKYMGVVRSTVLVDPDGKVAFHWPNVKARGHAQDVLDKLASLT